MRTYRVFTRNNIRDDAAFRGLPRPLQQDVLAAAAVLPFRVNCHVLRHLIDWSRVPDDPYFRLTFPRLEMLPPAHRERLAGYWDRPSGDAQLAELARAIRASLNPHPADQATLNVPEVGGGRAQGLQHKYGPTVLFFPAPGQTCHAYCTYCFRWAQFVGEPDLRFAEQDASLLAGYVSAHPEVTDVLLTGGDPLVMSAATLRRYLAPLLAAGCEHVQTIRIGTKSLGYWPYRFLTDADAVETLALFEEVVAAGKHLALMSHFSHPRELSHPATQRAVAAVRSTGAVIRSQEPIVVGVNDSPEVWAEMWRLEVHAGIVPYYSFVLRDTGTHDYFRVPLARAVEVLCAARRRVSGLAQTARGPVMSASPGKVLVESVVEILGRRVFGMRFIQARNPEWVGRTFFAEYDEGASWLDDLTPAFGESEFFFDSEMRHLRSAARLPLPLTAV